MSIRPGLIDYPRDLELLGLLAVGNGGVDLDATVQKDGAGLAGGVRRRVLHPIPFGPPHPPRYVTRRVDRPVPLLGSRCRT